MARKTTAKKANKPNRPRDPNQFAHALIAEMTERTESAPKKPKVSDSEISRVMAELGRRGGKIGGKKRAASMTAERRREIALKAARSRWDNTSA